MFTLSTVHTDECTYTYENVLVVIPNFSPTNIEKLSDYIQKTYEMNEDQLLELLNYEHHTYNGVVLKDKKSLDYHLIIQAIECIGE